MQKFKNAKNMNSKGMLIMSVINNTAQANKCNWWMNDLSFINKNNKEDEAATTNCKKIVDELIILTNIFLFACKKNTLLVMAYKMLILNETL